MEIDVEDIESLDPPEEKEEPWCSFCHEHTDYRRKWDAFKRADLDGGTYSEVIETPHCIDCGRPMLLVSTSRKLVLFVNTVGILTWAVGLLIAVVLFGFSFGSLIGLLLHGLICYLFCRLPGKSRLTLRSWKKAKKENAVRELLQKI
jgi:hypothetical protein